MLSYNETLVIKLSMTDGVLSRLKKGVSKTIVALDTTLSTCVLKDFGICKKKLSFNEGLNQIGLEYAFEQNPYASIGLFKMIDALRNTHFGDLTKIIKDISFNPSGEFVIPVTVTVKSELSGKDLTANNMEKEEIERVCVLEKSVPYRLGFWIENGV